MIWINVEIPIGEHDGENVFVQLENRSLLYADPRRLTIRVRAQMFDMYGICIHAMDSSVGKEAVSQWWQANYVICRDCTNNAHVLCIADGHMRIRNTSQPWVGDVLDMQGSSGTDELHMVIFAKYFSLIVVNTHDEYVTCLYTIGT